MASLSSVTAARLFHAQQRNLRRRCCRFLSVPASHAQLSSCSLFTTTNTTVATATATTTTTTRMTRTGCLYDNNNHDPIKRSSSNNNNNKSCYNNSWRKLATTAAVTQTETHAFRPFSTYSRDTVRPWTNSSTSSDRTWLSSQPGHMKPHEWQQAMKLLDLLQNKEILHLSLLQRTQHQVDLLDRLCRELQATDATIPPPLAHQQRQQSTMITRSHLPLPCSVLKNLLAGWQECTTGTGSAAATRRLDVNAMRQRLDQYWKFQLFVPLPFYYNTLLAVLRQQQQEPTMNNKNHHHDLLTDTARSIYQTMLQRSQHNPWDVYHHPTTETITEMILLDNCNNNDPNVWLETLQQWYQQTQRTDQYPTPDVYAALVQVYSCQATTTTTTTTTTTKMAATAKALEKIQDCLYQLKSSGHHHHHHHPYYHHHGQNGHPKEEWMIPDRFTATAVTRICQALAQISHPYHPQQPVAAQMAATLLDDILYFSCPPQVSSSSSSSPPPPPTIETWHAVFRAYARAGQAQMALAMIPFLQNPTAAMKRNLTTKATTSPSNLGTLLWAQAVASPEYAVSDINDLVSLMDDSAAATCQRQPTETTCSTEQEQQPQFWDLQSPNSHNKAGDNNSDNVSVYSDKEWIDQIVNAMFREIDSLDDSSVLFLSQQYQRNKLWDKLLALSPSKKVTTMQLIQTMIQHSSDLFQTTTATANTTDSQRRQQDASAAGAGLDKDDHDHNDGNFVQEKKTTCLGLQDSANDVIVDSDKTVDDNHQETLVSSSSLSLSLSSDLTRSSQMGDPKLREQRPHKNNVETPHNDNARENAGFQAQSNEHDHASFVISPIFANGKLQGTKQALLHPLEETKAKEEEEEQLTTDAARTGSAIDHQEDGSRYSNNNNKLPHQKEERPTSPKITKGGSSVEHPSTTPKQDDRWHEQLIRLHRLCQKGEAEKAELVLKDIADILREQQQSKTDHELTSKMFVSVINAYTKSNHPEARQRATNLVTRMVEEFHIPPNVAVYTALMNAWARTSPKWNDPGEAVERIFKQMVGQWEKGDESAKPDEISLNVLLTALARSSNPAAVDRAEHYFRGMDQFGIRKNVRHYTSMMAGWKQRHMPQMVEDLFQEQLKLYREFGDLRIKPNEHTHRTRLQAWSDACNVKMTMRANNEWLADPDCDSAQNTRDFTNVLKVLSRYPDQAEEALRKMVAKSESTSNLDCLPDTFAFTTVIRSHANSKQPNAGQKAMSLFNELNRLAERHNNPSHLKPTLVTYMETIWAIASHASETNGAHFMVLELLRDLRGKPDTFWKSTNIDSRDCLSKIHKTLRHSPLDKKGAWWGEFGLLLGRAAEANVNLSGKKKAFPYQQQQAKQHNNSR